MSADSPRRTSGGGGSRGLAVPAIVPPQVVSDRSILDSAIGFINEVTLANQPHIDPKDTITWARFETAADISDPRFGDDWELEGNAAPPLILILGYGLGVQVWAIPANGEAVEVLSWRHGIVSALRVLPTPAYSATIEEHGRADELVDAYAEKRPLIALVDGSASAGVQPQFCAVNFISLKTGTQIKTIKFKNPVLDILANRSSIVITFHERIAVFDASTLDDRLSITTCYPSPGINPNPVALGPRWLAYAEHKLLHTKRSGGGCDGDGVPSYTATVLNAAKSFGKGLRELGEQVAAGLTGSTGSGSMSKNNSFDSCSSGDVRHPGVITILDIKNPIKDYSPTSGTPMSAQTGNDPIVAHFIAHSEAIVSCEFDNSGMLLVTADRRGHDFHVFRIQPHPVGSSLAAVHHLYVLHRGDTSAKVQNIAFSLDSRWVAVSTLRGTTHVFPITPYGGTMGVRTHTSLHVVNKLSRFHRSAGLSADGRSSSPISHSESTTFIQSLQPYHNPTLPPFSRPTVVLPLTQLRQPFTLGSPPGSAGLSGKTTGGGSGTAGSTHQRQRLSSLSDDSGKPLSVCATFAKSRSWLLEPPNATREAPHRIQRKAVDSLFVMAGHGALIQYDLDVKLASNVAKEKICDDTPIELEVEAKAQWNLGRRKDGSQELTPPLSSDNWLIKSRNSCMLTDSTHQFDDCDDRAESWLSQVEIITHAGPHRRLWMGPQFVFKTYNTPSGSNLSHVDAEAVEIGVSKATSAATAAGATAASAHRIERSSPLNMPLSAAARSTVPVLIESGSYSSIEQSPKLMDRFRHDHMDSDYGHGDTRLKEDLADAMRESPSVSAAQHNTGRLSTEGLTDNTAFYDALAEHDDDDPTTVTTAAVALANVLPNIYSFDPNSKYESLDSLRKAKSSIEKIVNPLGTVTTIMGGLTTVVKTDMLDEVVSQLAAEECVIHENCDESLFRPVVAIFCDEKERQRGEEEARRQKELAKPPETVGSKLIVPVIEKAVDDVLNMKEKQKYMQNLPARNQSVQGNLKAEQKKFNKFSGSQSCEPEKSLDLTKVKLCKEVENKREITRRPAESPEKTVTQFAKDTNLKQIKKLPQSTQTPTTTSAKSVQVELQEAAEEETAMEFKRMTPLPAAKPNKQTANPFKVSEKATTTKTNTAAAAKSTNYKEEAKLESDEPLASTNSNAEMLRSTSVHTEVLNVAHLTDSLMDLEESCSSNREPEVELVTQTDVLIPAKVYEAPAKQSTKKSNKKSKRQNKSSSNSESEEVIELKANIITTKTMKAHTQKYSNKDNENEQQQQPTTATPQKGHVESAKDWPKCFKSQQEEASASSFSPTKIIEQSKELEFVESFATQNTRQEHKGIANIVDNIEPKSEILMEHHGAAIKSSESDASCNSEAHPNKEDRRREFIENLNTPKCSTKSKKNCCKQATSDDDASTHDSMEISQHCDGTELMVKSEKNYPNKQKEEVAPKQGNQNDYISLNDGAAEGIVQEAKKKDTQKTEELNQKTTKQIMQTTKIRQSIENEHCERDNAEQKQNTSNDCSTGKTKTTDKPREVLNQEQEKFQSKSIEESAIPNTYDDLEEKTAIVNKEEEITDDTLKLNDLKSEEPKSIDKLQKLSKRAKENRTIKSNINNEKLTAPKEERAERVDKSKSSALIEEEKPELHDQNNARKDKSNDNDNEKQKKEFSTEKNNCKIKSASIRNENLSKRDQKLIKEDAFAKEPTPQLPKDDVETLKAINPQLQATDQRQLVDKQKEKVKEYKIKIIEDEGVEQKNEAQVNVINERSTKITALITSNANIRAQHKANTTTALPKDSPKKRDNNKNATLNKHLDDIDAAATPLVQTTSAWSTLSGAAMINKNLEANKTATIQSTAPSKSASIIATTTATKVLPNLPMPLKPEQDYKSPSAACLPNKLNNKKQKKSPPASLDDFPALESFESLPPLPALQPLEDITPNAINNPNTQTTTTTTSTTNAAYTEQQAVSLINFESPLQEQPNAPTNVAESATAELLSMEPTPRGFQRENLIFALCGSLHYEHEMAASTSSTTSLGKQMPSSVDNLDTMSTTTTTYKHDKFYSSSNSSASEDIIVLDEKKLTKKQRRKKQQQQHFEMQKEKEHTFSTHLHTSHAQDMCEELRPLIGSMTDSQMDIYILDTMLASDHCDSDEDSPAATTATKTTTVALPTLSTSLLNDKSFTHTTTTGRTNISHGGGNSTTTDSEGPMPATTSDDNICSTASFATTTTTPNKIKTKKLEHKINLIAAIEAATSSSTSSAEESGLDVGIGVASGGGRASDSDILTFAHTKAATTTVPITQALTQSVNVLPGQATTTTAATHHNHQQSAMKKKTKRRKR